MMRLRHAVAAAVHHLVRAGLQRGLALLGADVHHHDVPVLHRAQHGDRVEPEAAGADHHDRLVRRDRHRLADRRIDGDAGAGIGRRHRRIQRAGIDQMPRMRRDHVRAVAAIGIDAEAARREAHVVLLRQALLAGAAAEPGEHDAQVADLHALAPASGPSFATRPTISCPIASGSTTPRSFSDIFLPPPMS